MQSFLSCSGELLWEGELIAVCVKTMHDSTPANIVQQEVAALGAVRGLPHMIQEVHPRLHNTGAGPARIVTRYCS